MKLSRRDRNLLIVVGLVGVTIFIYQLVYKPLVDRDRLLAQELKAKEVKLKEARLAIRKLSKLMRESKEIKARLAYAESRLPGAEDIPSLLKQIEQMAKDSGVDIPTSIVFPPSQGGAFYRIIPIRLSMGCSLKTLIRFLYQIETSSRLLDVQDLHIASNPDATFRADMTVATFVYKPGVAE